MNNNLKRHIESRRALKKKQVVNMILKQKSSARRIVNYYSHVSSVIENNIQEYA